MEITLDGEHTRVAVNGTLVTDYTRPGVPRRRKVGSRTAVPGHQRVHRLAEPRCSRCGVLPRGQRQGIAALVGRSRGHLGWWQATAREELMSKPKNDKEHRRGTRRCRRSGAETRGSPAEAEAGCWRGAGRGQPVPLPWPALAEKLAVAYGPDSTFSWGTRRRQDAVLPAGRDPRARAEARALCRACREVELVLAASAWWRAR